MTQISKDRLDRLQAYWRATNFLGAAQLYLKENPLLLEPLAPSHIKSRLLGHWGTQPGINLIYGHLNRLIQDTGASIMLVVGPGHGAPAVLANLYLEGTLQERYPDLTFDVGGLKRLMRSFSWPHGTPSHLYPGTPGMINEGGELGHSLAHAFGAAFDNPDLIVACIVGDGEAETGALASSWQSNKFLNPAGSGAVLPILHLNGVKLSGPSLMGRMSDDELDHLFIGYGYASRFVTGDDPETVHQDMWHSLDWAYDQIHTIQRQARTGTIQTPRWPLIVLRTPKGWTCPKTLDGHPLEGTHLSHQLPIGDPATNPAHLQALEAWLRSYHPQSLFTKEGRPIDEVLSLCPQGDLPMGRNKHANGGELRVPLRMPEVNEYAVAVNSPGSARAESTRELSKLIRDIFRQNDESRNFRFFSPDETTSNRMDHVYEASGRAFVWPLREGDQNLSAHGRVMEILSEETCEGWLEGYLLTGRHGLFACDEAFIPIVDSMMNQFAKWLKVSREISWRKPLSSLNYLLTSHVWRQDQSGYSHQVPTFVNNVANKRRSVARIYFPPDANSLLAVADQCLRSEDYVNLMVSSKQMMPQWLDMEAAREHCGRGISVWPWASNDSSRELDVVLAAIGDVATEEVLAATALLRRELPEVRLRVVNVVDLFTLTTHNDHPHGLDDMAFLDIFTADKPVIFAFHGYPSLVHELLHHRPHPERFHVRGFMEEGRTTTPFDMLVLNHMSRYHLAIAALQRAGRLRTKAGPVIDKLENRLSEHNAYIRERGEDVPEVRNWRWSR